MKNYKAIFSDIDGTLLNSSHKISPLTEVEIKKVVEKNIPFVLVSARPPYAIKPFCEQLNLQYGMISYSGALILDHQFNPLYSVLIDNNDLLEVEKYLSNYENVSINYYSGVHWYCTDKNNNWVLQEEQITNLQAEKKTDNLVEVHKILLMADPEIISEIEKNLKKITPQLSIHRSKDTYLEIMNKKATKSQAIQFMQELWNIPTEQIIAFGDNFNDLDMLEYVGLGIAMENAPQEIKQKAKKITASNNDDGIALALQQIFSEK